MTNAIILAMVLSNRVPTLTVRNTDPTHTYQFVESTNSVDWWTGPTFTGDQTIRIVGFDFILFTVKDLGVTP